MKITPRHAHGALLERREAIVHRWTTRILNDPLIPEANRLDGPELRDSVPRLLEAIADALAHPTPKANHDAVGRLVGARFALEHAADRKERNYSTESTLRELAHLRSALLDEACEAHLTPSMADVRLVLAALDEFATTSAVEVARANLEAHHANALFKEQLLGIVSHDLRSPLNAIIGSAVLMLKRNGLDERAANALTRIVSSGQRATRLIHDLLDFTQARLGSGLSVDAQPLDLHEFTQQVVDEVYLAHPGRDLEVLSDGDGKGCWDADRLAQVITNLVGNALAYSPETESVLVRTVGAGETVSLEVHNGGPPIASDLLPHLFEPMIRGPERPDGASLGVGLGLYIVREIVRAHGGSVDVTSDAATGTTFRVELPRQPPQLAR